MSGRAGGFQYSDGFLDRLWRQDPPSPSDTIVSMFQLVPERIARSHRGRLWFYVDQTLRQLFTGYGLSHRISPGVQAAAIGRERAQYLRADGVICHSAWAARDVVESYGVPPTHVHRVVCGANLNTAALQRWEASAKPPQDRLNGPLRLVFVGKDWQRKGLDRLIAALDLVRRDGVDVHLTVIGVEPESLPLPYRFAEGVHFKGVIGKDAGSDALIAAVSAAHVGVLLSTAEAGGIALREFCRLGLPVIAPDVGGAREYVCPGAAVLVGPHEGARTIADVIKGLAQDPDRLLAMQRTAFAARHRASWDHAVDDVFDILRTHHTQDARTGVERTVAPSMVPKAGTPSVPAMPLSGASRS
ncbi:MAG: glycosyltransferase family 4 protein [Pseudomonadota bacterium]